MLEDAPRSVRTQTMSPVHPSSISHSYAVPMPLAALAQPMQHLEASLLPHANVSHMQPANANASHMQPAPLMQHADASLLPHAHEDSLASDMPPPVLNGHNMAKFLSRPRTFSGGSEDRGRAPQWLDSMQRFLTLSNQPVDTWALMAETYLTNPASNQWFATRQSRMRAGLPEPSWAEFCATLRKDHADPALAQRALRSLKTLPWNTNFSEVLSHVRQLLCTISTNPSPGCKIEPVGLIQLHEAFFAFFAQGGMEGSSLSLAFNLSINRGECDDIASTLELFSALQPHLGHLKRAADHQPYSEPSPYAPRFGALYSGAPQDSHFSDSSDDDEW